MFRIQAGKILKFINLLLICAVFTNFVSAQTRKPRRKNVVRKAVEKVDGKKQGASKPENAKAAVPVVSPTPPASGGETKSADDKTVYPTIVNNKKGDLKKPADGAPAAKGRLPVIFIPGLIGSELVNKESKGRVWFDLGRAKDDDLRLPISPDIKANKDGLIPVDVLRKIQIIRLTPAINIYQKLIDVLTGDGFKEGKIDEPSADGYADTFYLFAYDWRLDNVENAQILLKKMDAIRLATKRPNLKFNVIAHSMGGLIARYAEMYGSADLTAQSACPTWKGAPFFNSISLVATPNAGSLSALDSMLNGFSLFGRGKINLPFVQNLSKFDLFTIPSIYQLLPHNGTARAFDENLKPVKVDVLDPATWEKYNWTIYTDPNFAKKFDDKVSQEQAKAYFYAVLRRARLFADALDAKPVTKNPVPTFYLGASCKETVDGMIIHKSPKGDFWQTDFGAANYVKSDGTKVSGKQISRILLTLGDGVVSKTSLLSSYVGFGRLKNSKSKVVINDLTNSCDEHNRLTGNPKVDQVLISIINNKPIEDTQTAANEKEKK